MINRLAFTAMRLNREQPARDAHPLARADGGWYPGKHFDPTDILTDPKNWLVWKQFLIFFFSMIGLPIATFLGIEIVCRTQFKMHVNQSTTVAALASMIVLQALVFTYVRLAAIEKTEDDETHPLAPSSESGLVANAASPSAEQLLTRETAPDEDEEHEDGKPVRRKAGAKAEVESADDQPTAEPATETREKAD